MTRASSLVISIIRCPTPIYAHPVLPVERLCWIIADPHLERDPRRPPSHCVGKRRNQQQLAVAPAAIDGSTAIVVICVSSYICHMPTYPARWEIALGVPAPGWQDRLEEASARHPQLMRLGRLHRLGSQNVVRSSALVGAASRRYADIGQGLEKHRRSIRDTSSMSAICMWSIESATSGCA